MSGTDWTQTPNLHLYKPTYDADDGAWGGHLNANMDVLDSTITALPAPPQPSNTVPTMDGAGTAGASAFYTRGDHQHPTDTSRAPIASPALQGVPTAPTPASTDNSTALATTAYVKNAIALGASIVVADAAPVSPQPNTLWWDSVGTNLYLWYNDGNSTQWVNVTNSGGGGVVQVADNPPPSATAVQGLLWWDSRNLQLYLYYNDGNSSQWVPTQNQNPGIAEAPQDSAIYGRQNAGWTNVATAPAVQANAGRNVLHNSTIQVVQRGAGPWSPSTAGGNSYTADRWATYINGSSNTVNVVGISDVARSQIGDESARVAVQLVVGGTAGAADYVLFIQAIEKLARLAGKTVTVSFWANASAALNIGVSFDQFFGSGGSPSATANGTGQRIVAGTTWQRYSLTFNIPSIQGMTLGTNNDDKTIFNFWFTSGTTYTARSGSVGVQSGTFNLWGIQCEIGSVATPLEKIDPGDDLRRCQRFYQVGQFVQGSYGTAGQNVYGSHPFIVSMRATPSITIQNNANTNLGAPTFPNNNIMAFAQAAVTATGAFAFNLTYLASADL